jgi:hypothetical protein
MKYAAVLTVLLIIAGCSGQKQDTESQAMTKNELVQRAADTLTAQFMKDLKGELMAAMQDGGPANAIAVCKVQAPEIAQAHSEAGVWTIERVTDRPRNPRNMADEHQMRIMEKFRDTTNRVDVGYGEWQVEESGDTTFMYYKPIRIVQMCLGCHGPADQLSPEVKTQLAETYPEDRATGYQPGDLRGMFVVTMQWPAARSEAEKLVTPQQAH